MVQLERMEPMNHRRQVIWDRYHEALQPLEQRGDLFRPYIDPRAAINYHIYALRVTDQARRDSVIDQLRHRGIGATFHYIPLHSAPYARAKWGYRPDDLPITERVAASLIRLPLYPDLGPTDQDEVIEALYKALSVPA
jgi:dTDP-4-amino-4,6-dideoxygalactose transaminase